LKTAFKSLFKKKTKPEEPAKTEPTPAAAATPATTTAPTDTTPAAPEPSTAPVAAPEASTETAKPAEPAPVAVPEALKAEETAAPGMSNLIVAIAVLRNQKTELDFLTIDLRIHLSQLFDYAEPNGFDLPHEFYESISNQVSYS